MLNKEDFIKLIQQRIPTGTEILQINYEQGMACIKFICVSEVGCVFEIVISF